MTQRVGIVVDSGAALPPQLAAHAVVVPLRVEMGGDLLREGIDIDAVELQRRLDGGEVARSSTPSPGAYLEAIHSSPCEEVLVLTMAAGLSGMNAAATVAARLAAEEGDTRRITVVDTRAASLGLGVVARIAVLRAAVGDDLDAVSRRVERAAEEHTMLGTLRTLAPLARSGRLPALVAGLGDLLHIRPVFELREGRGRRVALCRSEPAVLRALTREATIRMAIAEGVWLLTFHNQAPDDAGALRDALRTALPVVRSETVVIPAVASVYTGPGMVGAALLPLHGDELEPPD